MILRGESRRAWRKTSCRATVSTTNSTLIGLESNQGFRDEKPAANRLSHRGAASTIPLEFIYRENSIFIVSLAIF